MIFDAETPRLISRTKTHRRWATMTVATFVLPGGEQVVRDVEDHGDAAAVLPYDPVRRVAFLVRQLRAAPLLAAGVPTTTEPPAGRIDPGETPEATARREVLEEVGVRLRALEPVGCVWALPGVSTERAHLYLAPFGDDDRVGEGGGLGAEDEAIRVVEAPLAELGRAAVTGAIEELKLLVLVQALMLRRPGLFR